MRRLYILVVLFGLFVVALFPSLDKTGAAGAPISHALQAQTAGSLKLQYMTTWTSSPTIQVKPQFRIVNAGTTTVPLSELTIRYYFTTDSAVPLTFNCVYTLFDCGNLGSSFVPVS